MAPIEDTNDPFGVRVGFPICFRDLFFQDMFVPPILRFDTNDPLGVSVGFPSLGSDITSSAGPHSLRPLP